ncbi:MAG: glycosyltransferase family 2 protein [bacterium]
MPKVSVILPVYNEETRVATAIMSILNQTYTDFEFLIINDCSQDNTETVIRSFRDKRIHLINNENNLGVIRSSNKGIFSAVGKYIARIDADDFSLPTRLEKQVHFLDQNPEVAVLGTAVYHNDNMRNEKFIRIPPQKDRHIKYEMVKYVPLEHSSVMVRAKVLQDFGGYDENYGAVEDLELWTRIGKKYQFANLSEPLVVRNIRPNSYWHTNYNELVRQMKFAKVAKLAIFSFSLPKLYYFYVWTKVFYGLAPNQVKRLARKILSKSQEIKINSVPSLPKLH